MYLHVHVILQQFSCLRSELYIYHSDWKCRIDNAFFFESEDGLLTLHIIVRMLREELQLLQEQGSYVGEVVKPMDKKKVLVKVSFISVIKVSLD